MYDKVYLITNLCLHISYDKLARIIKNHVVERCINALKNSFWIIHLIKFPFFICPMTCMIHVIALYRANMSIHEMSTVICLDCWEVFAYHHAWVYMFILYCICYINSYDWKFHSNNKQTFSSLFFLISLITLVFFFLKKVCLILAHWRNVSSCKLITFVCMSVR